jgi:hypothetical protein
LVPPSPTTLWTVRQIRFSIPDRIQDVGTSLGTPVTGGRMNVSLSRAGRAAARTRGALCLTFPQMLSAAPQRGLPSFAINTYDRHPSAALRCAGGSGGRQAAE